MPQDINAEMIALRAYSRALCPDHDDAEALLARALRRAQEGIGAYEPDASLRIWLLKEMRRAHFEGEQVCTPEDEPPPAPGEEPPLATALRDLPVQLREAVTLVVVMGQSYDDVAEVMDRPVGAIIPMVRRACDLLQTSLDAMEAAVLAMGSA